VAKFCDGWSEGAFVESALTEEERGVEAFISNLKGAPSSSSLASSIFVEFATSMEADIEFVDKDPLL
jgi:hypothetical protein